MQHVLNFSGKAKKEVKAFLGKFPKIKTNTVFEELRCRIGESTVTLYTSGKVVVQGKESKKAKEMILEAVNSGQGLVLGIDETGRGEGFGPFVVAGVLGKPNDLREVRDSKKTRNLEKKLKVVEEKALGIACFVISSSRLSEMHEAGISMNRAEAKAINAIYDFFKSNSADFEAVADGKRLDGSKKEISFLVKGDDINPVVGAASIVAKSIRENSGDKGKRRAWGRWQKK